MDIKVAEVAAKVWLSGLDDQDPQLLSTGEDKQTVRIDNHDRYGQMVSRSTALTERIKAVRLEIASQYHSSEKRGLPKCPVEGVIYLIYQRDPSNLEEVTPIYVGIARTVGKKGSLSALIENGWMRFADTVNSNGHIGKINEHLQGKDHAYQDWADALFTTNSSLREGVVLNKPTFVRIEQWGDQSQSIVPDLGATPLAVEEMLRIWILNLAGKADRIVNKDGNDV